MVDAILAMGKSLEMQITAEGIEQMEAARWLSAHGCDFAQGWLFGRPCLQTRYPLFLRVKLFRHSARP